MMTIVNASTVVIRGLSTDEKPIGRLLENGESFYPYPNGSEFFEMDTGDTYYFNQTGNAWIKPGVDAEE